MTGDAVPVTVLEKLDELGLNSICEGKGMMVVIQWLVLGEVQVV